jgi:uncharacterized lipoprotein YehR (DUF1307 family)
MIRVDKLIDMKLSTMLFVLVFSCVLVFPLTASAQEYQMEEPSEETSDDTATGSFDGVDLKEKLIWVNDTVYAMESNVKVKGTSTKVGLLSDLKQGEVVKVYLMPNEDDPSVPFVTLIERQ